VGSNARAERGAIRAQAPGEARSLLDASAARRRSDAGVRQAWRRGGGAPVPALTIGSRLHAWVGSNARAERGAIRAQAPGDRAQRAGCWLLAAGC